MSDTTIRDWLVSPEAAGLEHGAFLEALVGLLREEGVPLDRVSASLSTRHPELLGHTARWTSENGAESTNPLRNVQQQSTYLDSPVFVVHRELRSLRVDLTQPTRFPVCRELAEQGYTDYLIQPLPLLSNGTAFASWSTRRPGGFSASDLALLEAIRPTLSLRLEANSAHLATEHLLQVYLGRNAAERVLQGQFLRGSGERIEAALWFCDLRGFTSFSDEAALEDVVAMLDRYFEAVAGPVSAHGGEVLKFIGDAMLAVFPVQDAPEKACMAALCAAREALQAGREALGEAGLSFGIALHLGEVMYGNIGAADRLDFTVIGAAVNEASRVEGLCKVLGEPLLITDDFAAHVACGELRSLGEHALRGARRSRELFTPAGPR